MPNSDCVDQYLHGFRNYDASVDVVSAFEMIFTASDTRLPGTVRHFERFPSVPVGSRKLTPDFTVLFEDGTALIGEVSRISLRDESVDSLCKQLMAYDSLEQVPSSESSLQAVTDVDVLLLVPSDVGPDAARRILRDRLDRTDHWYDPSVPPTVMQFHYDQSKYMIQRLQLDLNGIPNDNERSDGLGAWLGRSDSINVPPETFRSVKAGRAFMNDPADPLYLATLLWTKVFPLLSEDAGTGLRLASSTGIRDIIRDQFGMVGTKDVRRAMLLLSEAKLAVPLDGRRWATVWYRLRSSSGDHDVARIIAQRACRPPRGKSQVERTVGEAGIAPRVDPELTLFSLLDE